MKENYDRMKKLLIFLTEAGPGEIYVLGEYHEVFRTLDRYSGNRTRSEENRDDPKNSNFRPLHEAENLHCVCLSKKKLP